MTVKNQKITKNLFERDFHFKLLPFFLYPSDNKSKDYWHAYPILNTVTGAAFIGHLYSEHVGSASY